MTLDEFIEESLRLSREREYHPTTFIGMWYPKKDPAVIERLVKTTETKTGYKRMVEIGLKEWSLEQAVLDYPCFSKEAKDYARFRLSGALDG